MSEKKTASRREFFALGAQATLVAGLTGALPTVSSAETMPSGKYRLISTLRTGAKEARGIAVDSDDAVLVAADRAIRIYEPDGKERVILDLREAPTCLTVSGSRLFIGFRDHIEIYNAGGRHEQSWPRLNGSRVSLTSLALTDRGELLAADGGSRLVWHIDAHGKILRQLSRPGADFSVPRDFFPLAVSGDHIIVSDLGRHCIQTFTTDGRPISKWGKKSRDLDGFGGCCNPISFAITRDKKFVTAEGGLPRIKLHDAHGKFEQLIAGPEVLEANARGSHEKPEKPDSCHAGGLELAVDSRNRILALDRVEASVLVFSAT